MTGTISRREVVRLSGAAAAGALVGLVGTKLFSPAVERVVQTVLETTTRSTTVISTQKLIETKIEQAMPTETRVVERTMTEVLERTVTVVTPYKKELPNLARNAKINVWSFYYPWYSSEENWTARTTYTPLLGVYNSRDRLVINRHIDWATGYGINAFFISWWGRGTREDVALKELFLKSDLAEDIKFAILYESLKDQPPFDPATIISDLKYLDQNYFQHPRYLTVNGKPVVFFYLARAYPNDAVKAMMALRDKFTIYLVGDVVYWQSPREAGQQELMTAFDAITAYNMHTSVQSILDNYVELLDRKYAEWFDAARAQGVSFIPQILPGFDDRKYPGRTNLPLPRSVELFTKQF